MFPPDADQSAAPSLPGAPGAESEGGPAGTSTEGADKKKPGKDEVPVLLGEPKGIRYHATRLRDIETGRSSRNGGRDSDAGSTVGSTSPTRSRIGAAIAGTPCKLTGNQPSLTFSGEEVPGARNSMLMLSRLGQIPHPSRKHLAWQGSRSSTPYPRTIRRRSPRKPCKS